MKLTKGKISKLYNKKRQSLKKHKKIKSSYKKRTFRNKRKVNLARKSLKKINYRGGEGENNDTPKNDINEITETPVINADDMPVIDMPVIEEHITEQPITEEPITEEPAIEQPVTKIPDNTINKPSQEQPELTGDDVSNKELIKSLKTISNYIADTVADKALKSQPENNIQDGFSSVNKVAETMATSGGSKFKKTRRFILTKKNKTRHNI